MGSEEYKRLYQLYLYVFSTPPDSEEREKRLAEISDEDSEKLWDFYSGLCSGRIKPENINKESEESSMTYQQWRAATKSNSWQNRGKLSDFERENPTTAQAYKKRLEAEKKKRSEILAIKDTRARHKAIYENMALFER